MKIWHLSIILGLAFFSAGCTSKISQNESGAAEPIAYIQDKGSDTMVNLALAWAEQYQKLNPDVSISVTGGGSGTGIQALLEKTTDIANASRSIKKEEMAEAKQNGIEPVEFVVAGDAIAIIVHLSNPVDSLTIQQISDIYSGKINNWKEIGGEDRPIVRLSRETNSGTHVYFLEQVIRQGEKDNHTLFATNTLLLPSSEVIGVEIRENPNAIGYDGLGYVTSDMKVIAVAKEDGSPYVLPSAETVNDGSYPIARDLYMYTAGQPTGPLKEYIDWVLSKEAQQIVQELGFVPNPQ